jgi:hypothetical protein
MTIHMFDILTAMASGKTAYRSDEGTADIGRMRGSAAEMLRLRLNGWVQIRAETYILTAKGRAAVTLA